MGTPSGWCSKPAAMLILAVAQASALAGPHDSVSSDGSVLAQWEVANSFGASTEPTSKSFAGKRARVTEDDLAREGVEIYGNTQMSAAEFKRATELPDGARSTGGGAEVILGVDRRERVYTNLFPSRARVLITFSGGRCSGTLINANTVVTAGHCLHSGGSGGAWYSTTSYKIYPGKNGSSSPYGFCTAKQLHSVLGWTQSRDEQYDYGAIKLNCSVGNTVGWYGYTTAVALNDPAIIGGYPGDKPLDQWIHADKVRAITTRQIFYSNDTTPGSSGSSVWWDKNGAIIIGIHAYGTHGSSPHSTYNHGIRIVTAVANNFNYWKGL